MKQLLLGIDVGTQGVRIIISDSAGTVLAQYSATFPFKLSARISQDAVEQDPNTWWECVCECITGVLQALSKNERNCSPQSIICLSVTSTSGTVVLLDDKGDPIHPAIMYNDRRSASYAGICNELGADVADSLGYSFSASFGLPKMIWFEREHPEWMGENFRWIHATDFIIGKLVGDFQYTDETNALKSGYDLLTGKWPGYIEKLGLEGQLPKVIQSGTCIGNVCSMAAARTGLSTNTQVIAGMTDGCASQIAAGAVHPGDWNSTIGTTLVIKGVTDRLYIDLQKRIYSHKHPMGYWMPGGASNTGGEALEIQFGRDKYESLNNAVNPNEPSGLLCYPLQRTGERFPFHHSLAKGFEQGMQRDEAHRYAGFLEGIGYLERLSFDLLDEMGVPNKQKIYVSGGAAKSSVWLQIRANILNTPLYKPRVPEAAMGMCIVAASQTIFSNIQEAVDSMVKIETVVEPSQDSYVRFDEQYAAFKTQLVKRGYLKTKDDQK
ncbi:FGGY-family carbohydrate kinase [Fodinisporobacter ferrooxydans]|uniref:FGGY-family carbohydrate kinase n=1 Tax=Fodinisporobacter ferrooxydans TaxID=2901836 RepID=A0ABY4CLQ3_9BACL|nr:FGGY-family carbohydrate kinase [Alicyclobacillaceae bacterium MYW30-H2]